MTKIIFDLYPNEFKWKNPPYEYEFERNPFDVIHGSIKLREQFEKSASVREIAESWQIDEGDFKKTMERHLLYQSNLK